MSLTLTDEQLLANWRKNRDADAFSEIVVRYGALVFSSSLRILSNAGHAEDVAQECFIELITSRAPIRKSLASWLHTIAICRALDRLKSEDRREARESKIMPQESSQAAPEWDDIKSYLDEAIADLPERLRVPVILRFLEGQTYKAIGTQIGLTHPAVKGRIDKGVERIRRHLARKGITVGAAALAALLGSVPTAALPAAASAHIGMLALSGITTAATTIVVSETGAMAQAASFLVGFVTTNKVLVASLLAVLAIPGIWLTAREKPAAEPPSEDQVAWLERNPGQNPADLNTGAAETPLSESSGGIATTPRSDVFGKVVDSETGDGVREIALTMSVNGSPHRVDAMTNETGEFRFEGLPSGDYVVVPARGPFVLVGGEPTFELYSEFRHPRVTFRVREQTRTSDVRLEVARGAVVKGRVYDQSTKKGIAGIAVWAEIKAGRTMTALGNIARTDSEGFYRIEGLPERDYDIVAQWRHHSTRRGSMPVRIQKLGETIEGFDIALDYGLSVTGRVVDRYGSAVEDADVRGVWRKPGELKTYIRKSAADGSFELGGAGFRIGGDFFIQASKDADLSVIEGAWPLPERGLTDVLLRLEHGASIAGVVFDKSGQLLADAAVTATHEPDYHLGLVDIDGRGFYRGDFGYGKNTRTGSDG